MPDLIHWQPFSDGSSTGFAGTHDPVAFHVSPPNRSEGEKRWMVLVLLGASATHRYGETEAEAKQQAETWLREFVTSLGAIFASDLREHLTEQAAIARESAADCEDSSLPDEAHYHDGRTAAFRDLIKWLDHELETRQ